jgi:HSP20 family protein
MSMQSLFYEFGEPFRTFDLFTKEMNRHFREAEPEVRRVTRAPQYPTFDLFENELGFVLVAELPSVLPSDLTVTVDKNQITIAARRDLPTIEGYELRARERRPYAFERTFELPAMLAADKADATLENGVLTVTLQKAEEKRPLKIQVKSA